MTTAAMAPGVVPLVTASGAGAISRFDMGLVIATGIAIGILFTLFVVPAMYRTARNAPYEVFHPLQVRQLGLYVRQTTCRYFRGLGALRTVIQPEQLRGFVKAETQALRRFDEAPTADVGAAVAPYSSGGPLGRTQQTSALVEPDGLYVNAASLGEARDREIF